MTTIDLTNKIALITGSARRVGKVIALELARHGMHIVIHHHHSDQEADSTAAEIRALGIEVLVTKADLRSPDEVRRLFQAIRERFGRLDVLVNNASNFNTGSILDLTLDQWNDSLTVNLTAPFLCSQQAALLMRESKSQGAIINIADQSAFKAWKTYPAHTVSKAGLVSLTNVLALSLAPDIRVNAIAPGPVLRDAGNDPDKWQEIGQRLPLARTGQPEDVAQAVVFLATQPFITGEIIHVDGGEHLR